MYQHPIVTAALAEQRRADLMAAAQHARDRRLATTRGRRALQLTLRSTPRSIVSAPSTQVVTATR